MQSKRMKALAAAALTALIGTNAYATGLNLTWDWDGEAPFGGPQDGFWFVDGSFAQWSADGGASYVTWDNSGDHAIFGTAGGTVTVDPSMTNVASLKFNDNYTLTGSVINLGSGAAEAVINVLDNKTATINNDINTGTSSLRIGNAANYGGTLILGGQVSGGATTIAERMTLKLGRNDALATNQVLNTPAGSAIATFDLNGFDQTISNWSGANQNVVTNTSGTLSTLTITNTLPDQGAPRFRGNLKIVLNGGGSWTMPSQNSINTGDFVQKPLLAAGTIVAGNNEWIGSAAGKIVVDATAQNATFQFHPANATSSVRARTYTRDIQLIHGATTNASLSVNSAYNATLTGSVTGGTVGGSGLRHTSGQGAIVLAGNNSYVGSTVVTGQSGSLYLAHNNALGDTSGVTLSGGLNTLGFMNGIFVNKPAITIDVAGNNPPNSGFGTYHAFTGDNTFNGIVRTSSSTSNPMWIGADAGASLTLTGAMGTGRRGIVKVGYGTVTLAGPATWGVSGAGDLNSTYVNEGILRLDFSQAYTDSTQTTPIDINIINNSQPTPTGNAASGLVLGGGTLEVKGRSGATNIQRFADRTAASMFSVKAGASAVKVTQNNAASVTVSLGRLLEASRLPGSTIDFTLPEIDINTQLRKGNIQLPQGGIGTDNTLLTAGGAAFATVGGTEWAATDAVASGIRNIVPGSSITSFYTANDGAILPNSLAGNADMSVDTTTTLAAPTSITSLRFNNSGARTVDATGQSLATGGILITSNVGNNLSRIIGGTLTGATGTANQDLVIVQNNTANHLQIDSLIADNGTTTALTKSGAGRLILTAANTYSGETHLNEGMIKLEGSGALGSGRLVFHGGVLGLPGGSSFTRALGTGGNNVSWSGSGGFAAYGGDVTVNLGGAAAALTFGSNPNTAGSFVLTGSALILGAPDATGTVIFANPISLRAANQVQQREFRVENGTAAVDARLTGVISGDGGLLKTGAGTLEIMLASTNLGPTTIDGGTVKFGANSAVGNRPLTVKSGSIDQVSFSMSNSRGVNLGGGAPGTSSLIATGTGTFTIGADLDNFSVIYDGNVANDNGATISGKLHISGTSTFETFSRTFTVNDSTAVDNDLTLSADVTGTAFYDLVKAGAGKMLLSGNSTYAGKTAVNAGTLRASGGSAIGDNSGVVMANVAGASLELLSSETVGSLSGGGASGGNIAVGSNTLTTGNANTSTTYAGVISGSGALVKSGTGTQVLTGTNTYGGGTTVNAGLIGIAANAALGASGTGVTLNGGGIRFDAVGVNLGTRAFSIQGGGGVLDTPNANSGAIGGAVTGSGALTKNGAGTVTLSNTGNTYSGGTVLNAGTVEFAGNLGSGGPINFNGGGIKFASGNATDITAGGRVLSMNSTNTTTNSIDTNGNNVTFSGVVGNGGVGHLIKRGSGTLTIDNFVFLEDVPLTTQEIRSHGGTLVLNQSPFGSDTYRADGGEIVLAQSTDVNRVLKSGNDVGEGMKTANGGRIDLKNNKGIVYKDTTNSATHGTWDDNIPASAHYTGVYGLVQRGRNGGTWDGHGVSPNGVGGVMTSMPDALAGITGIGVGRATSAGTFAGEPVAQDDVKLMYTYVGDADLNGVIDGDDFATIDASFSAGGVPAGRVGYDNGDFDYNGRIDADDYWYIDRNYVKQQTVSLGKLAPALPAGGAAAGGVTAVPEPSSIALIGLAAVGALRRRRRQH